MKRLKKAWLPAFCLALSLLLTPALAADAEPQTTGSCGDNATWSYDEGTQTLTVSGSGEASFASWNSSLHFAYRDTTEKVVVEDGITALSGEAFKNFKAMTEVSLPDSLKDIGRGAFEDCEQLKAIAIPDGVTEMRERVFWGCKNLEHVVIPVSVTTFEDRRFMYDGGFGQPVFADCDKLTSAGPMGSGCAIEFGWTDQIPAGAFLACRALEQITFPEGVTKIGEAAFAYTNLSELTVPDTVASIEKEALYHCQALTAVSLPAGLEEIGADVFKNCSGLNTITFAGGERQWKKLMEDSGNQDLEGVEVICTGTDPEPAPDPGPTPGPTPAPTPGILELDQSDGGLGKRLTVSITGGHWLTIQVRRENSVSITMIQAAGKGETTVYFSAPVGSTVQVWETEELMQFDGGAPDATVLASGSARL